jgi:predicted membrane GTPase involved in stress response
VLYASGKQGWATKLAPGAAGWAKREAAGMEPLLDTVLAHCPPPASDSSAPFAMVVTMMAHDAYVGRLLTGRIVQGQVRAGSVARAGMASDLLVCRCVWNAHAGPAGDLLVFLPLCVWIECSC